MLFLMLDHPKVEKNNVEKVGSYILIYIHILPYTSIYLCIPPYTPTYIKILNIRKMRSDIRRKNGHKWTPRGSPWVRMWHVFVEVIYWVGG